MPIPSSAKNQQQDAVSDERQAEVTRLYLQGSTMREVSRQMDISVMTVARDLQRARETWKKETAKSYDELLPEKLAQLDAIRSAAWEGWKRSLQNGRRKSKTTSTYTDGFSDSETNVSERATGNPVYLQRLESCLRLECQLRGLLDKDAGNSSEQASEVVEVVIRTREEHEQFKTLSMEDFKSRVGKVG